MLLVHHRQLALKALNERLRSVPAGTSWPLMDDDTEPSELASSPVSSHTETASSTLPLATDVNSYSSDTPAAESTASSSASQTHDHQQQQQH